MDAAYRLPPEPDGPRPAAFDTAGDVWQRGADGLWYRALREVDDEPGWTWFEVNVAIGPLRPTRDGHAAAAPPPYTDELALIAELPTAEMARLR